LGNLASRHLILSLFFLLIMNKFFLRRPGFTLIELLVVISIIGILIGMLLPAVQQVREAARRTVCKNNLRQLSLALHNYESGLQQFPPGYAYVSGSDYASTGYSIGAGDANHLGQAWGAFILPQLEQGNIYDQVDFKLPGFDVANLTARETEISTFLCPTDSWSIGNFVVRDESVSRSKNTRRPVTVQVGGRQQPI
jgi:prepilin-type N-terminal cleavage/methylation domain-containing protein